MFLSAGGQRGESKEPILKMYSVFFCYIIIVFVVWQNLHSVCRNDVLDIYICSQSGYAGDESAYPYLLLLHAQSGLVELPSDGGGSWR